jgi:RNA polymerase sigma-70 factor (ECF subfamily)
MTASGNNRFPTTQWTLIGRLHQKDDAIVRRALEDLCAQYHYPLYCYIRSRGFDHHDAQDALHDFLSKLLRNQSFQTADQEKGRLRSFLIVSLQRFLIDWRRQNPAAHTFHHPLAAETEARYRSENLSSNEDPELLFDRKWAHALLQRALEALANSYEQKNKGALFTTLRPVLLAGGSLRGEDSARLADSIGMREGTLRVALSRLLREFRHALEHEVLQTVSSREEIEAEIRHLKRVLETR